MKWLASLMTLEMASRSLLRSLGMKTSGEACQQRRKHGKQLRSDLQGNERIIQFIVICEEEYIN